MSCGRLPLFCKVYEVHVQLKDYDWRLVSKEVTSRSRKFWTCLMLFCLSFCLWTLGVMATAIYTYLQAVNVHYSDKRLGGNSRNYTLYRIKISNSLQAFTLFLSFRKVILMLAFMKAYLIITFFCIC